MKKLDELMQQSLCKRRISRKNATRVSDHAAQTDALQKEKMDLLMNHMYKRESKQEEKNE